MNTSEHIAKHFKGVHSGGNWTDVNLKTVLEDITWQEATKKLYDIHTIAALTYHVNYFVSVVLKVLQGEPLQGKDSESFDCPAITSEAEWTALKRKVLTDAEQFEQLLAKLPEEKLWEDFTDAKYGSYYGNIAGIIEHTHYHLGQIVIIKKVLRAQ